MGRVSRANCKSPQVWTSLPCSKNSQQDPNVHSLLGFWFPILARFSLYLFHHFFSVSLADFLISFKCQSASRFRTWFSLSTHTALVISACLTDSPWLKSLNFKCIPTCPLYSTMWRPEDISNFTSLPTPPMVLSILVSSNSILLLGWTIMK